MSAGNPADMLILRLLFLFPLLQQLRSPWFRDLLVIIRTVFAAIPATVAPVQKIMGGQHHFPFFIEIIIEPFNNFHEQ